MPASTAKSSFIWGLVQPKKADGSKKVGSVPAPTLPWTVSVTSSACAGTARSDATRRSGMQCLGMNPFEPVESPKKSVTAPTGVDHPEGGGTRQAAVRTKR